MRHLRRILMTLNVFLIGWVIYVLKDILLYGHHIAIEPNQPLLIAEIVFSSLFLILAIVVFLKQIQLDIKNRE